MNNKKAYILFIIVIIVAGLYFTVFRKHGFLSDELNMKVTDTNEISSFEIAYDKTKVVLSREKGHWMVNGIYHANDVLVKRLLRLSRNLDVKLIVAEDDMDAYIADLKNEGIELVFYSGKNKLNTYWIGGFDSVKNATLMMKSDLLPVFVSVPGLSSDLEKFVQPDAIFWRDKRIFDFKQTEIREINFIDYTTIEKSFLIEITNTGFKLYNKNKEQIKFEPAKISRYLSYFTNIRFESLVENFSQKQVDSIINQSPMIELEVVYTDNRAMNLKLLQKSEDNNNSLADLNMVYGLLNNEKPLVLISYFAIDPLLKDIDYFKKE